MISQKFVQVSTHPLSSHQPDLFSANAMVQFSMVQFATVQFSMAQFAMVLHSVFRRTDVAFSGIV